MSLAAEVHEEPQSEISEVKKTETNKIKSQKPKNEKLLKTIEEIQKETVQKLKNSVQNKPKFTVYGKVNSKGIRYEVTKIIEADDKDIASSIYKERIKQEFQGVRNITCIKPEEFKEGDIDSLKEIELPKATESEEIKNSNMQLVINGEEIEIPKDLNEYEAGYLVYYYTSLSLSELKLYTCYYSPKKKINNSYRKNNLLLYTSFNEVDAMGDIRDEMTKHNIPFKEKYVHELKEISLTTLLTNTLVRNEVLTRAKEKFGSMEEAYETYKERVHNSSNVTVKTKEVKDA